MAQTLTTTERGLFIGATADHRRSLEDAIGFRDRMDEHRRKTRYVVPDAAPIVGPRGGIRRPNLGPGFTASELEHVCEDVDEEERVLDLIEEKERELRILEEEQFPDVEDDEGEDWPLFVAGVPLDAYLAQVELDRHVTVNGEPVSQYCEPLPDDEAEMIRNVVESELVWEDEYGGGDEESFSRVEALGWRDGCQQSERRKADARTDAPHDRQRQHRLRDAAIQRRTRGKQELRERFLTGHVQTAAEEAAEDERIWEELFYEVDRLVDTSDLDHWTEISDVAYRHIENAALDRFDLSERGFTPELQAFAGHVVDVAGHCWVSGMSATETDRLLTQLTPALLPTPVPEVPLTAAEGARILERTYPFNVLSTTDLDGDPVDSDWDIDPPRQSGEFGRGVALLDDDFDDVPPSIVRLARKRDDEDADERARRRKYAH